MLLLAGWGDHVRGQWLYATLRHQLNWNINFLGLFSAWQVDGETHFGKLVREDVISLGCAIVEMLIPAKVQLSTCGLKGKQREKAIIKLWETNQKLLPRFAMIGKFAL